MILSFQAWINIKQMKTKPNHIENIIYERCAYENSRATENFIPNVFILKVIDYFHTPYYFILSSNIETNNIEFE